MNKILFVNVTRFCNVLCERCYITKENRARKEILQLSDFEKVLKSSYFHNSSPVIIYEGGEVTTISAEHLESLMKLVTIVLPHAKQQIITNLMSLPDSLIVLAKKYCNSFIETTYALAKKTSLNNNETLYHNNFKKNLKKAIEGGLTCPVNVETNKETIDLGYDVLGQRMLELTPTIWEFDPSVAFNDFLETPVYLKDNGNYPIFSSTATYKELSDFLLSLFVNYGDKLKEQGSSFGLLDSIKNTNKTNVFNTCNENSMLTINPDGSITTSPLFSDMIPTYLGNLINTDIEDILIHKNRRLRVKYEFKRRESCQTCEFFLTCQGGTSHAPLNDNSGECVGLFQVWKALLKS